MMGFTGLGLVIVNASINTLVQTIADEDKRGRALSLLLMCFLGMLPIGGLLFGELARSDRLGPRATVILGVICVAVAIIRFGTRLRKIREHARPVLIRRAVLPAIAQGLEVQSTLSAPPEQSA